MSNESINLDKRERTHPGFNLHYISISKYEGDWQSHPHTHHFTELFYVLDGKGDFLVEDECFPVKPNDLIIINPHVEHTEKTLTHDPMEYIVFAVEGMAFTPLVSKEIKKSYSYYSYPSPENHLMKFSQIILKEFKEKKPGFDIVCQSLLQALLIFISRDQNLSIISDSIYKISRECALAKRYIDTNYAQEITLDTLAEITHINKFYLAHSFSDYMGRSPINYLNDVRVKASMELLINTSYSIAQVASGTGFSSQSYFSQVFRKDVGMTPQQYRKLHAVKKS